MTMTKTCLSQRNIIIEHKDGYEYSEEGRANIFILRKAVPSGRKLKIKV